MGKAFPIGAGEVRSILRDKEVIRTKDGQYPDEANFATVETIALLMEELVPGIPQAVILYGEGNYPVGAINIGSVVEPDDTGEFDNHTLVKDAAKARWREELGEVIKTMFPPDDREKWTRTSRITMIALPA